MRADFPREFCSGEFASSIRPDTAGEFTTRRKEWIIPRILVEMDRTRALLLSELALRCEQIFPHRFCPIEFASSIPAVFETDASLNGVERQAWLTDVLERMISGQAKAADP